MSDTTTSAVPAARPEAALRQPSALRIGWSRGLMEIKIFFRERDGVVFTFALPIILLVILGSIFSDAYEGTGITVSQVYAAALTASGVMGIGFQNLGIGIAVERDDGTLKRLAGTPMPPAAYFIGKVISVLAISAVQMVILLAVAVAMYDLTLPSEASAWAVFGWVSLLGVTAAALLGIAVSSLPRSAKSASPVISLLYLVLQFISGVFIPFTELPDWLTAVAAIFPLKWMCQGLRSVFLGAEGTVLEATGSYELDRVALVLAAWVVGGLVLCLTTFRWKSRRDG